MAKQLESIDLTIKTAIMILTVDELKKDINNKFKEETSSIYFGLGSTSYIYKFDRLIITIGHYKTETIEYKLTINNVVSCRITEETYINEFKDETYEGFSFFWHITNSRFKQDFNLSSSYGFIHGLDHFNNLKSYRIVGQNNFIDVLTTEEPIIELIENTIE